jgi:hypothetical protein
VPVAPLDRHLIEPLDVADPARNRQACLLRLVEVGGPDDLGVGERENLAGEWALVYRRMPRLFKER